jgi:hypothetical protein
MSDIMLIGVLNMPMPDDPKELDILTWVQFLDRARQAAARIASDADEIERLREALANEQARGVHTCHEHCERPMCVMQRAITERDSIIERLRARLAEAERDAARYRYLRQVDRVEPWENLIMLRPIWSSLDIDAAIDAAMGKP